MIVFFSFSHHLYPEVIVRLFQHIGLEIIIKVGISILPLILWFLFLAIVFPLNTFKEMLAFLSPSVHKCVYRFLYAEVYSETHSFNRVAKQRETPPISDGGFANFSVVSLKT
jgi:hypothetical protein